MIIDAWWYENKQTESEILQPELGFPKTQLGIYAELEELSFPFKILAAAKKGNKEIYSREFEVGKGEETTEAFEVACSDCAFLFKSITEEITGLPDEITVKIFMGEKEYSETIKCEYARLHGKITDFEGKPYPAVVAFRRIAFGTDYAEMAVWSNKEGEYSVTVPKGRYNNFFVCDHGYGQTVLENWSWNMLVDRDEEHNFKIGNGEVYSLVPWCNNGGGRTMFFWFRPMILPSIKNKKYEVEINGVNRNVNDISPELEASDIKVTLNGRDLKIISLQRIYETGEDYAMPAYIIQTERPYKASDTVGKQTAIVEYNNSDRKDKTGYLAQSQGRTQFYFNDFFALALK